MPGPASFERVSASVLSASINCPAQAFWQYFLEWPVEFNPYNAHGIAIHEMFRRFNTPHRSTHRYPFLTVDKLVGAWSGWWWGAVKPPDPAYPKKSHGFGSFREPWQPVRWYFPDQPGQLAGRGINIMKKYFAVFDPLRHDGRKMIVERSFGFTDEVLRLTGRLDLLMYTPDGAFLVDYKPHAFSEPMRLTGIQPTFYQIAYERVFRRHAPQRMPLVGMFIYDYSNGALQPLPLRDGHELGVVRKVIWEWHWYFRGVLTGIPVPEDILQQFETFNRTDILHGDITPKLPRGEHCRYCQFTTQCRDWEQGKLPTSRQLWYDKRQVDRDLRQPSQLRLPLSDHPVIARAHRDFARFHHPRPEQQSLKLDETR
jgi:hypothetical protein